MWRIYLEAFLGVILAFVLALFSYELTIYQLTTDYDFVLDDYEAEALHALIYPTYRDSGVKAAEEAMQNYTYTTRQEFTPVLRSAVPIDILFEFQRHPDRMVIFDDDRALWFRFDQTSKIYRITEDEDTPLRRAIFRDDNVVWLFFLAGFSVYCAILIWFISRRARALEKCTLAFAEGDLSVRAKTSSAVAVGTLNKSFNLMADRISNLISANRMLTNAVAHELRTPIFRMQWQADMLAGTQLTPKQQQLVNDIIDDADEMGDMIEELIYHAKMERPETTIEYSDVTIAPWLLDQQSKWQRDCDKAIVIDCQSDLLTAPLDASLFKRALDNLVRNAMRYAQSQIRVQVSEEHQQIVFRVEDDGIGVDEKDWPHLFDAFYSADKSRNKATSGFGLGLAIVKQIVKKHGGTAEVSRSVLGGAKFSLSVPCEVE
ncbi:ATP-binding protein [Vibrio sp.]|uniref:ATP-binding protein n=1 Tax=Vibrio sp. TaxID=678 RepID=UPI003D116DF3